MLEIQNITCIGLFIILPFVSLIWKMIGSARIRLSISQTYQIKKYFAFWGKLPMESIPDQFGILSTISNQTNRRALPSMHITPIPYT